MLDLPPQRLVRVAVYTPYRHILRRHANILWVSAGPDVVAATEEGLGSPAYFYAPRPGRLRRKIVYHKRHAWVAQHILELLAAAEAPTSQLDNVQLGIVPEAYGHDVRLTGGSYSGEPAQSLAAQIVDLGLGENAQMLPPGKSIA